MTEKKVQRYNGAVIDVGSNLVKVTVRGFIRLERIHLRKGQLDSFKISSTLIGQILIQMH